MNLGWSGRTVFANECGEQFNFVDLDGHIPKDRVMASVRAEMEGQPKHWVRPGTIDSTTDRGPKGLIKGKITLRTQKEFLGKERKSFFSCFYKNIKYIRI